MIKISDGLIYITCGEACLVMREKDGELHYVCFGRRVEFEDDVTALGVSGGAVFTADIVREGSDKNIAGKLRLESAEVVPAVPGCATPLIRAEKSLKVELESAHHRLRAELYFTPHTRGGISRRCEIVNTGNEPVTVRSLGLLGVTLADDMSLLGGDRTEIVPMSRMRTANSPIIAVQRGGDLNTGDALGIYPIYGGRYKLETSGRRVELSLPLESYTLDPGNRIESPEVLCVYSDRGMSGLARAYHDIVRDGLIPEKYASARRPIAMLSTAKTVANVEDEIKTVARLGADTYIIRSNGDVDKNTDALEAIGCACSQTGVKLGAVCALESAEKNNAAADRTAVFTDKMKGEGGTRVLDLTSKQSREYVFGTVYSLVSRGVKHIRWENAAIVESTDAAYEFDYMCGVYKLLNAVAVEFRDVVIEGGGASAVDIAQLAFMPYYGFVECKLAEKYKLFDILPPCAIGSYVVPPERVRSSFKTDFDAATTGSLSYMFDPSEIDENIARAMRAQIFSYQDDSALAVGGDLYRLCAEHGTYCVALVSKDKSRAYVVYVNESEESGVSRVKLRGLDAHNLYHVRELGKTFSGAALVGYGVDVGAVKRGETAVFHLRQVVDYE